jgi:hypothetical protein
MAKNHGARQQKKLARQKAKRTEKRTTLLRRNSADPTIRLARADTWPVIRCLVAADIFTQKLGQCVLARQETDGRVVASVFLVDVGCLGVKNAFWHAGTPGAIENLIQQIDGKQKLLPIDPAALVKLIQGAVAYAASFGFRPHADFRHAALLLKGIDPKECADEFEYGRDGKPFYFRGPYESEAEAHSIVTRVVAAGGHYIFMGTPASHSRPDFFLDDDLTSDDDRDEADESEGDDSDHTLGLTAPPKG